MIISVQAGVKYSVFEFNSLLTKNLGRWNKSTMIIWS